MGLQVQFIIKCAERSSKLPFWDLICCYVICYHVTSFTVFWLCKDSLFSVSCQRCSSPSFSPIIDARRCQSSLKLNESSLWMKPAGGWLFPARRMDSCWQRMFLLLSWIKIKVHSAESGFLKRLSQTPQSTWPWLSICIIGVAADSARHSLPCFWSVCTSGCVAVGKKHSRDDQTPGWDAWRLSYCWFCSCGVTILD